MLLTVTNLSSRPVVRYRWVFGPGGTQCVEATGRQYQALRSARQLEVERVDTTEKADNGRSAKKEHLEGLTVPELREVAKDRGLTGYSRMRKAELVDAIIEED